MKMDVLPFVCMWGFFVCLFVCFVCFVLVLVFMAAPMAYGSSQARSQIRAAPADLHHSNSCDLYYSSR